MPPRPPIWQVVPLPKTLFSQGKLVLQLKKEQPSPWRSLERHDAEAVAAAEQRAAARGAVPALLSAAAKAQERAGASQGIRKRSPGPQ